MRSTLNGVRIAGISAAVPSHSEEILEGGYLTAEGRKRFVDSTGIERRRLAAPDQWCSDFAAAAAERLLDDLGWDRGDIGVLVFVTQTPDMVMPSTACVLQHRLGLSNDCAAFDVNLGCSGFAYGLKIAGSILSETGAQRALLLVGDTPAKGVLPSMRNEVPPLFGDAATATALEYSSGVPEMLFDLKTDGSEWNAICERRPGGRPGLSAENFKFEANEVGEVLVGTKHRMRGEDVFNFSVREVPVAVTAMLEHAGKEKADIDAFMFHQANKMINAFIAKRLGLDAEKVPGTLTDFGNTSSATIPLTMVHCLRDRLRGDRLSLLLCGFGVGLSWATAYCETDRIVCPELIEI